MRQPGTNWETVLKKLLIPSVNSVLPDTGRNLMELVTIRRSSGVTLQQISEATRISMHYLQAIENGSLGKLPGGVYTSNYLRQYTEACRNACPTSPTRPRIAGGLRVECQPADIDRLHER
jgi:hypothetical protein